MDVLLNLCLALGLSAACGFRVFVPLLVISAASSSGYLRLSPGFEWLGEPAALTVLTAATILEVAAYYVPWLDNLLDTIATPAAVVAGIVSTASVVSGMDPFFAWTVALIAGGGVAGVVQTSSSVVRLASSTMTAGFGNPLLATAELVGSFGLSMTAFIAPLAVAVLVLCLVSYGIWRLARRARTQRRLEVPI